MGTRAAFASSPAFLTCGRRRAKPFVCPCGDTRSDLILPSRGHSQRLNAVSFLSKDNQIHSFLGYEAITAEHMIYSLDKIASQITKPTVIVLDNASIHRAKIVREKRAKWKKQGLRVFFLPPYCPHLNKVETLWRMVKYQWLAPRDYSSFETLCKGVENILGKIGQEYRISFA